MCVYGNRCSTTLVVFIDLGQADLFLLLFLLFVPPPSISHVWYSLIIILKATRSQIKT